MLIFITETFKLDLSELNVRFSENNSFFNRNYKKNATFPITIPRLRSFLAFFEFVESHNSTNSNDSIKGVFFKYDKFYEATLSITSIAKDIKAVIYFEEKKHAIYDKKLVELPWEDITVGNDMYQFAKDTIAQDNPATKVNFVQIYAPEKYKENDFGPYNGYINNNVNGDFVDTRVELYSGHIGLPVMNEIRPFIYFKEILLKIFNEINYTIIGNLITNDLFIKALMYHDNSIYVTNKDYKEEIPLDLQLIDAEPDGYFPQYSERGQNIIMDTVGTFIFEFELTGEFDTDNPLTAETLEYKLLFDGVQINSKNFNETQDASISVKFKKELIITVADVGKVFSINIISSTNTFQNITGKATLTGVPEPTYNTTFNLKELMLDLTVDNFITMLADTFLLTIDFNHFNKTVAFNFFEEQIETQEVIDLSKYVTHEPRRSFGKSLGYKISFPDGEEIYYNKKLEELPVAVDFTSKTLPFSPLKTKYVDGIANVEHQEGNSLLFFENNTTALPLLIASGINLTRRGFITKYLKKWYFENLNSEMYSHIITLPIYIASKIKENSKLWLFNNFFIIKSLQRQSVGSLFQQLDFRLFKIKNFYTEAPVSYQNPVAVISDILSPVTEFFVTATPVDGLNYPNFTALLYGYLSTDPNSLPLSYVWSVVSSPDGNASGIFYPQYGITDNSNVKLKHTNIFMANLIGDYTVQLTVTNTAGLSNSINAIVHVIDGTPPAQIILTHNSLPTSNTSFYTNNETININYNGVDSTNARIVIALFNYTTMLEGAIISTTPIANVAQLIQAVEFAGSNQYVVYIETGDATSGFTKVSNYLSFWVWI